MATALLIAVLAVLVFLNSTAPDRRFCQESLQSGAFQAASALYANLAKPLFAMTWRTLLIPRLGT
jgi:hypothetical protein